MSLRPPEHLPASLQSLKGMTTEHDQGLGLMSCRDMGGRVEDGVGKAQAHGTGWDSRKLEDNSLDYSPRSVLLSLRLFSLSCWIKLSFVSTFIIIKSLPVLLFSLLSFHLHQDPCSSNSFMSSHFWLFWNIYEATGCEKNIERTANAQG